MSSPLEDVKQLLASTEGTSRKVLIDQLHEIIVSVETPEETANRISLYPLHTSVARIGHELKIFESLASSESQSVEELQILTNAHPITLGRLLRYMASVGLIREAGINRFEANQECQNLASPRTVTILTHFFENGYPLFREMPTFLRNNKYQNVTDGRDTVFQLAYNTDLDKSTWFSQNPDHMKALTKFMDMQQTARGRWMDDYPIERDTKGWDPNLPVFVDVGGNVGHYCAMFKAHFPYVPGRVILQDLPEPLTHALQTPGVEHFEHDLFKPQPVKGAKFYHLGWVFHNWNDEMSKQILRQIRPAMTAQSVLLINDTIRPETGVPSLVASLDLVVLATCGSRQRTVKEWTEILGDVGLVVKEHFVYNRELCHGIISAALE